MATRSRSAISAGSFPATRISAITAAASGDRQARAYGLETLVTAYRVPVYKYVRLRWNKDREEAEDLTHGFFADAIARNHFARFDPGRARFRTFLRTCLDSFIINEEKAARRLKRGGDVEHLLLDVADAEEQLEGAHLETNDVDGYFEREFARSLFTLAVADLRASYAASGRAVHLALFEAYILADDDERPTYRQLAEAYAIAVTDVTNYLAAARRDFRRILLDRLRRLTVTDDEFRSEARALLGIRTP